MSPTATFDARLPYLEHYQDDSGVPHRIGLDSWPFRIGRCATANYVIYSRQVSKEHAEIVHHEDGFKVRDLGSTNGTYVNGVKVQEAELANGDILHIAHFEFRFGCQAAAQKIVTEVSLTESAHTAFPYSLIRGRKLLEELLTEYLVSVCYQPIVELTSGAILGYEALGRGNHEDLSRNPAELLLLADRCRLAPELSRLFRIVSVERSQVVMRPQMLFLNVHAAELRDNSLVESLREAKDLALPEQRLVVEMHENVVADLHAMRRLRDGLDELNIGLAYDDFGTGQSRLLELIKVPPDYLKLDMSLIRGIEKDAGKRTLVAALVNIAKGAGVKVIAEGVETPDEAQICAELKCDYGQGYLFGRPQTQPSDTPIQDYEPTTRASRRATEPIAS